MLAVTADTLQGIIGDEVKSDSHLMTDGLLSYRGLDKAFSGHSWADHDKEYVCGNVHTNTAESMFSLLKRGIMGTFHHLSKKHLHRYLGEFDFRWLHRKVEDGERFIAALKATEGKRLYYRPPTGVTA